MERALELHQEAIHQAAMYHEEDKQITYELHRDAMQKELNQHLEDIHLTIESARRENLRDVWAQKTGRAETLLIMDSLMISGLFTLVVEGVPPFDAWPALVVVYSCSLAIAFAFLFSSLFLTMRLRARMSDFNIYNVKQVYTCGLQHEAYESYYECHCSSAMKGSTLLFYGGTVLLLVAAVLLQFTRWYLQFSNRVAGILFVAIAIAVILFVTSLFLWFPVKTRALNTLSEAQDAERDARSMDNWQMGSGPPIKRVMSMGPTPPPPQPRSAFRSSFGFGRSQTSNGSNGGIRKRKKKQVRQNEEAEQEANAFSKYLSQLKISPRTMSAAAERTSSDANLRTTSTTPPPMAADSLRSTSPSPPPPDKDPGNLVHTLSADTRRELKQSMRRRATMTEEEFHGVPLQPKMSPRAVVINVGKEKEEAGEDETKRKRRVTREDLEKVEMDKLF